LFRLRNCVVWTIYGDDCGLPSCFCALPCTLFSLPIVSLGNCGSCSRRFQCATKACALLLLFRCGCFWVRFCTVDRAAPSFLALFPSLLLHADGAIFVCSCCFAPLMVSSLRPCCSALPMVSLCVLGCSALLMVSSLCPCCSSLLGMLFASMLFVLPC
jgi:hypothetical protein